MFKTIIINCFYNLNIPFDSADVHIVLKSILIHKKLLKLYKYYRHKHLLKSIVELINFEIKMLNGLY